jgi:nitrogen fixation/metabolism regulation signal transduction histidine kinase
MNFNRELLMQGSKLIAFSLLLLSCQYIYLQQGLSAVVIILVLATFLTAIKLLSFHQQSKNKIVQVINALANNDPTLGLTYSDPLSEKLAQLRDQIQHSRLEAEIQAQYLQTLLIHLDISILVVDDNDNILHKNPASERLLGLLTDNISPLAKLGELISQTNTSQRVTLSWQHGEHSDTLSVHISCCEIQGKSLKVVSIQSIYQALIAKEQQAYKQLTRVLTHEVANSITPLASLAETAIDLLPDELVFIDSEDKEDLNEALSTLANRTSHLSSFIKSFHQITSLPKPNLIEVNLAHLIEGVLSLFKGQVKAKNIRLNWLVESSSLVMADGTQLEQAMINIIKNAIEAIAKSEQKEITLRLYQTNQNSREQVLLDIEDSGPGIAKHVIEQVFVPFFTTKNKGSGIGLSLSRQIMIQHGGDLNYIDKESAGACFRLTFGKF